MVNLFSRHFRMMRDQYWIVVLSLIVFPFSGCNPAGSQIKQVRPPAAAGSFYPESTKELNAILKKAFYNAPPPKLEGEIKALLVPHAGYVYSGVINAMGMKALAKEKIDTVYIIGTSHYADVGGGIIWQGKAFHTPLGDYPVDLQAVRELLKNCPDIHLLPRAWVKEHSVEVQIPYLQKVAPHAKMVPILMGTSTWDECWSVAEAVAAQSKMRKSVIICSADLSHYPTWADAKVIDRKMLNAVEMMDPYQLDRFDREVLSRGISDLVCSVCGLSALKTTMIAANILGANQGQLLHYANSGDVTKDKKRVVGYAALAMVRNAAKPLKTIVKVQDKIDIKLTEQDKRELLNIARAAITEGLATGTQMMPTTSQKTLLERYPVFVTLKRNGMLQGCIGMTEARLPLYQAVAQMACSAAFEDPRFQALEADELPYTDIEISVLSPLKKIDDPAEIILGIHGVMVKRGDRTGLFLPQVATDTGWSKEEFLDNLCAQKAHLPADIWRDKRTELYVFRVLTFDQRAPGK